MDKKKDHERAKAYVVISSGFPTVVLVLYQAESGGRGGGLRSQFGPNHLGSTNQSEVPRISRNRENSYIVRTAVSL